MFLKLRFKLFLICMGFSTFTILYVSLIELIMVLFFVDVGSCGLAFGFKVVWGLLFDQLPFTATKQCMSLIAQSEWLNLFAVSLLATPNNTFKKTQNTPNSKHLNKSF